MGVEAANAFLKTLEEPPDGVVIFLIAESAGGMLPTILSRCQRVRFPPLGGDDLAELIVGLGAADRDEASAIAAMSDGGLDSARALAGGDARTLRDDLVRDLATFPPDVTATAAHIMATIDDVKEAQAKRERLGRVTRFGSAFYREAIRAAAGGETSDPAARRWAERVATRHDAVDVAGRCLERLQEFDGHVAANASLPLAVETLAADLAKLTPA
ncbi:MAG: hypothetical protein AAGJ97_04340, partial [Planctomycetota bacterium]